MQFPEKHIFRKDTNFATTLPPTGQRAGLGNKIIFFVTKNTLFPSGFHPENSNDVPKSNNLESQKTHFYQGNTKNSIKQR